MDDPGAAGSSNGTVPLDQLAPVGSGAVPAANFPDGLVFDCGRNDIQRMLGSAVPSLVGEVIGRAIRAQLLGKPMKKKKLAPLQSRRKTTPAPEPVAEVPRPTVHSSAIMQSILAPGRAIARGREWRRKFGDFSSSAAWMLLFARRLGRNRLTFDGVCDLAAYPRSAAVASRGIQQQTGRRVARRVRWQIAEIT